MHGWTCQWIMWLVPTKRVMHFGTGSMRIAKKAIAAWLKEGWRNDGIWSTLGGLNDSIVATIKHLGKYGAVLITSIWLCIKRNSIFKDTRISSGGNKNGDPNLQLRVEVPREQR